MKKYFFLLLLIIAFGCNTKQLKNDQNSFPVLSGKYLGQNEPGLIPEIFAPNIVSTGMTEINACFSPDYTEFLFSVIMPGNNFVIMSMTYNGQQWSAPEVASFSGEYSEADPFITADGRYLYYVSKRPIDSLQAPKTDWDIWRVEKINGEWVKPEHLDSDINSNADDIYPSLTKDGTLYFSSGRGGGNNRDIYFAKSNGNSFEPCVKLSETINKYWEGDIFISPDEDYMIFRTYGRDTGSGLYITFNSDGEWSIPQNMGKEINKTGAELCPMVDPDGKYFFFSSRHIIAKEKSSEKLTYQKIKDEFVNSHKSPGMGKTDIYWVSSDIIENYRNKSR
ncbi:MAG: PD40 domain-containing protein [Bacteroidales bacterium]|nr:PD40 domain-containing protein [Bacteroidales bacterium]